MINSTGNSDIDSLFGSGGLLDSNIETIEQIFKTSHSSNKPVSNPSSATKHRNEGLSIPGESSFAPNLSPGLDVIASRDWTPLIGSLTPDRQLYLQFLQEQQRKYTELLAREIQATEHITSGSSRNDDAFTRQDIWRDLDAAPVDEFNVLAPEFIMSSRLQNPELASVPNKDSRYSQLCARDEYTGAGSGGYAYSDRVSEPVSKKYPVLSPTRDHYQEQLIDSRPEDQNVRKLLSKSHSDTYVMSENFDRPVGEIREKLPAGKVPVRDSPQSQRWNHGHHPTASASGHPLALHHVSRDSGDAHRSLPRASTWSGGLGVNSVHRYASQHPSGPPPPPPYGPAMYGAQDQPRGRGSGPGYRDEPGGGAYYAQGGRAPPPAQGLQKAASFRDSSRMSTYGQHPGGGALKMLVLDMHGSLRACLPHAGDFPLGGDLLPPQDPVTAQQRAVLFDFIAARGAHVILMFNTGCSSEDDLKAVRAEVKMRFRTESAMWSSFSAAKDLTCPCCGPHVDGHCDAEYGTGRGTAVLMLGPLAPRAGWVRSDTNNTNALFSAQSSSEQLNVAETEAVLAPTELHGKLSAIILGSPSIKPVRSADANDGRSLCTTSDTLGEYVKYTLATVRIKAGYTDVVFLSCDLPVPPYSCDLSESCQMLQKWRISVTDLASVISDEIKKGKNIIITGRILPKRSVSFKSKPGNSAISEHNQCAFLNEFLTIMYNNGVFLLLASHQLSKYSASSEWSNEFSEADRNGVSVFISAGLVPQLQQSHPLKTHSASSSFSSQSSRDVQGLNRGLSNVSDASLFDEDLAKPINDPGLLKTKSKSNSSISDCGDISFKFSPLGALKLQNLKSHILNPNGNCPANSFLRYLKISELDMPQFGFEDTRARPDDYRSGGGNRRSGAVLEIVADVKGWPKKAYEHR
jgi:hypothetical protein